MDLSRTTYRIMNAAVLQSGSLVDGGSNGGLAGDDCRILEQSLGQVVDVSGINIQTRLSPYLFTALQASKRAPADNSQSESAHFGSNVECSALSTLLETPTMAVVRKALVEAPRAVAVILGPLGVSNTQLGNLEHLYRSRGCSTVTAYSPPLTFLRNGSLKDVAQAVVTEATAAIEAGEVSVQHVLPVVVHLFSNGGSFVLYELEQLLVDTNQEKETAPFWDRLRLGYQFFDSCPCYIRMVWDTKHLSDSFPHPAWSSWSRNLYSLGASLSLTTWCVMTLSAYKPAKLWRHWLDSDVCSNQIYVYSSCDMLSDAAAVERLVEHRRSIANVDTRRFDDSNHCRMHIDHPLEYGAVIDKALHESVVRSRAAKAFGKSHLQR